MDIQYKDLKYSSFQVNHEYGENIHLCSNPYLLSLMAKAGHPSCVQPSMNSLVEQMYQGLFYEVVNNLLPTSNQKVETRMIETTEKGVFEGPLFDPKTKAVCVDLARAGTWPSHLFYNWLNFVLTPENIRQDHFYVSRVTNDEGEVTGASVAGSKIGGDVEDAFVFLPDPMGATGSTIVRVYDHYQNQVEGSIKEMIAIHLVITPEYIKKIKEHCPKLKVFALRLDRGLSANDVLSKTPGSVVGEKGLTEIDYIVPGAGGVGEVLNNSFV